MSIKRINVLQNIENIRLIYLLICSNAGNIVLYNSLLLSVSLWKWSLFSFKYKKMVAHCNSLIYWYSRIKTSNSKTKSKCTQTFPEWGLYSEVDCHLVLFLLMSMGIWLVFLWSAALLPSTEIFKSDVIEKHRKTTHSEYTNL